MSTRDKVFMNVPLRSSIYQSTFSVSVHILSPCILQLDFSVTLHTSHFPLLGTYTGTEKCDLRDIRSYVYKPLTEPLLEMQPHLKTSWKDNSLRNPLDVMYCLNN